MANKTTIAKNAEGYGYKYTDLAEIHKAMESIGISYHQYIETDNGADYVITVVHNADGTETEPRRGCRIVDATLSGKDNPAQAHGAAITYARRYSLLMALGWATTDDDAASLDRAPAPRQNPKPAKAAEPPKPTIDKAEMVRMVEGAAMRHGIDVGRILKAYNVEALSELTDTQLLNAYKRLENGEA